MIGLLYLKKKLKIKTTAFATNVTSTEPTENPVIGVED